MKKTRNMLLVIFVMTILLTGIIFTVKNTILKEKSSYNISYLSDEFINNYFKEIAKANSSEAKENMLIVISDKKIKESYGAINIIEAPNNQYLLQYKNTEQKEKAMKKFQEDKSIDSVEENGVYKTSETSYNSWGIENTSLDHAIESALHNFSYVKPVTVAIIDTGCDIELFNKYYSGKIKEYYNVLEQSTTIMLDEYGHGTHIAGTIAEGTPSNVKILPIKVSTNGRMYYSDIIAAMNYIIRYNKADVINMSFGGYVKSDAFEQTINSANEQNIISVAAAGNDNTNKKSYPATYDNVISIASLDYELKRSSFSNYGAEIDFAAPGSNIKSIMGKDASISKDNGNTDGDEHETISGTSMATPHAVSAIAILKGYNKDLTLTNIIEILKENAIDLGSEGWDEYYGHGLISFKDVTFCDGTYCDELGVYKDLTKKITNIETTNFNPTKYNYYSLTNILGSKVDVTYTDGTKEEKILGELPNLTVSNYDPNISTAQIVTIQVGALTTTIEITNPSEYECGWEYNNLDDGTIEITGYKNHGLQIEKLYIPETINGKPVVSFADDIKFNEKATEDYEYYTHIYLPSSFKRVGNYFMSNTKIKYVYGSDNAIEIGDHAFENSSIISIDVPIKKIGKYAFKDCLELASIEFWKKDSFAELTIGNNAFYNCKKLASVTVADNSGNNNVDYIGDYAFYNCISLAYFGLEPNATIGDYAFYKTFLLYDINLYNSDYIGQYAFYESGITQAEFSIGCEVIRESAFENCKNLKEIDFNGTRIENKAFWNSGVETVSLSKVEYIAENAFAYAPIKKSNGSVNNSDSPYTVKSSLGIIENGNKLLVGFTDAIGASNTKISEEITEIGNYAFTGNHNLKQIIIPANVTKIGIHAFEDCYQLENVYMFGNNIIFDDNTFKRNHEGEIQNEKLKIYVYKNSNIKEYIKNKNLNYRHIDPDEIIISNYEETYKAKTQLDWENLSVKLIYHEEEEREEILTSYQGGMYLPLGTGFGFKYSYQTEQAYEFRYGDTYFTVEGINEVGYSLTKKINITVEKLIPEYTIPTGITAINGQQLSDIELPTGFEWMNSEQVIEGTGEAKFKAKYIPTDTNNYEIVENIDITIMVQNSKKIIVPEITVNDKVYDGTTNIHTASVQVSNLKTSEYSIESAIASSEDAGERKAIIKLSLSDDKFKDYVFDNGKKTKEFEVNLKILKATITITDDSKDKTVTYDGKKHSIEVYISYQPDATLRFMDNNNEYTLDIQNVPEYTEVGTYIIKYKVYINDNYNEYYGQKTLTIKADKEYTINKYSVDETNKYISKIMVNTDLDAFKSNIILGSGYGINVDTKKINSKLLLYTGGKTRILYGSNLYKEYTNIVIGDINGDGAINSADLLKIRQHLLKSNILTGAYFLSSDINYDLTINSADLLRIRQHLLGSKPIN